ncbi:MAG: hypothetical protein LBI81_01735 [Puniceicoccales bacterium]|jgi:hypothetical protein|nr:hypothetical protein [Puniceicoccales bacterium]
MKSTSKLDTGKEKTGKEEGVWPLPRGEISSGKDTNASPAGKSKKTSASVVANVDIGFGNYLYIRGDGCGLSWDRGIQMDPVAGDSWQWRYDYDCTGKCFEFKVLVNDEVWSAGENFVAIGGKNEVSPKF